MFMKLRPVLFSVLIIMFTTTGCLFSPDSNDDGGDPPSSNYVFPDSADKLIANFELAYGDRNLDEYRKVLSEDYKFIARENEEYDYETEIGIASKMFQELAGEGGIAIQDITVDTLHPEGTWQPTPENDANFGGFPDSVYRLYNVSMQFKILNQNLIYIVEGPVIFYVKSIQVSEGTRFEMLGQVDQTAGS